MNKRLAFATLLALGLPACSFAGLVRSQAALDFSCPEPQVQTVVVSEYVMRASGCGKEALYNRAIASPLKRAAFDLSCPAEQFKMTYLDDNGIGVEGCGKKASYVWVDYAWVGR